MPENIHGAENFNCWDAKLETGARKLILAREMKAAIKKTNKKAIFNMAERRLDLIKGLFFFSFKMGFSDIGFGLQIYACRYFQPKMNASLGVF